MAMAGPIPKPEEEIAKTTRMPLILRPIKQSFIQAAKVSQRALEVLSPKLSTNDPIKLALKDASDPKKIEKVNVSLEGQIYTMEIYLKGQPVLLTIGVSDKRMVVTLTDKNSGNTIESLTQEGNKITINTPKASTKLD